MLTEDDVVDAVCRHLEANKHRIVQRCGTTQRGEDIVATDQLGVTLRIEAKGQTSNRKSSARFGKPFSATQCSDHVANALYAAAAMMTAHPGDRVAVAFPDTQLHREYVKRIRTAMNQLSITVFWVNDKLEVRVA